MKTFRPTKVKFQPMPIKEEETISRYLDGSYTGIWKGWFDKNFSEFLIIQRNYDAMMKEYYRHQRYSGYFGGSMDRILDECLEAIRLAYPYLHKNVR